MPHEEYVPFIAQVRRGDGRAISQRRRHPMIRKDCSPASACCDRGRVLLGHASRIPSSTLDDGVRSAEPADGVGRAARRSIAIVMVRARHPLRPRQDAAAKRSERSRSAAGRARSASWDSVRCTFRPPCFSAIPSRCSCCSSRSALRGQGAGSWRLFTVAAGGAAVFYVLFVIVLGVRQPEGLLFWSRSLIAPGGKAGNYRTGSADFLTTPSSPRRSAVSSGAFSAARCPACRRRSPWRCFCRSPIRCRRWLAIVMLASCYIGAEYGGSIPAILIRTPGTNAAAATVIDGYEMNRQGRAGEALGISLWSGVVGGLFGLAMLVLMTEPLARLALVFRLHDLFRARLLGLSVIAVAVGKVAAQGRGGRDLGLMIATIGTDPMSGVGRFTFGSPDLSKASRRSSSWSGSSRVTELMTRSGVRRAPRSAGRHRSACGCRGLPMMTKDRARARRRLRRSARSRA